MKNNSHYDYIGKIFEKPSPANFFFRGNGSKNDKPIYRIFKLEHLLSLFSEGVNTLVNPKRWQDPFENFYLKNIKSFETAIPNYQLEKFAEDISAHTYGQCWTFTNDSDAIWRIYSPYKTGISVKSTPNKLINAIKNKNGANHLFLAIGEVKYYDKDKIRRIKLPSLNDIGLQEFYKIYWKTLLTKRIEYRYEEEVRLIFNYSKYYPNVKYIENGNLVELYCDWNECLDEIILNPDLDDYNVKKITNLIKRLSISVPITQSSLRKEKF